MKAKDNLENLVCQGPSMQPTLKAGDILRIKPYTTGRSIRRADIIVFRHPQRNHPVAHRVVTINASGIKSRGDHNRFSDPFYILPDKVLGRVVAVSRGDKNLPVHSGLPGEVCIAGIKAAGVISRGASLLFGPGYRWLGQSGVIFGFSRVICEPRLIKFQAKQGQERYLVLGKIVVARLFPGEKRWRIRKPFRLFIDRRYQ